MLPTDTKAAAFASVSLEELRAICARPVEVQCVVRGQPVRITGRRLRSSEVETLLEMLRSAQPPRLPAETPGGEERYDLTDAGYLARVRAASANARAFALFRCFPIFSEQAPAELDRRDPAALAAWLDESGLEPSLLTLLYETVSAEVVGVPVDRVGFI